MGAGAGGEGVYCSVVVVVLKGYVAVASYLCSYPIEYSRKGRGWCF